MKTERGSKLRSEDLNPEACAPTNANKTASGPEQPKEEYKARARHDQLPENFTETQIVLQGFEILRGE